MERRLRRHGSRSSGLTYSRNSPGPASSALLGRLQQQFGQAARLDGGRRHLVRWNPGASSRSEVDYLEFDLVLDGSNALLPDHSATTAPTCPHTYPAIHAVGIAGRTGCHMAAIQKASHAMSTTMTTRDPLN
jgi:hypothetical protein